MSEHTDWQRATALRKIREALDVPSPPPMPTVYQTAAGYVGATARQVEDWWKRAGRK